MIGHPLLAALILLASSNSHTAVPISPPANAAGRGAAQNQKQLPVTAQNPNACEKLLAINQASAPARLEEIKRLYAAGRWEEVVCLTPPKSGDLAEIDYTRGMALSKLKRWRLAEEAFLRGRRKAPRDKRFPTELAGVAFAQKQYGAARKDLYRVLRLDPGDAYAKNFLATIFFLEGNLPAALKYWNQVGMPEIHSIHTEPQPRADPVLLNRAFSFSPGSALEAGDLRTTQARLDSLGIFSNPRIELAPAAGGQFNADFKPVERNGLGGGWTTDLITLLRGAPYETLYPEWFNIHGGAINLSSLLRWDPNKERVFAALSGPVNDNPQWRYRLALDARREYWNLTNTFFASAAPVNDMQLEKIEGSGEIESIVSGRLRWNMGIDLSGRTFRNVYWSNASAAGFFKNGFALEYRSGLDALVFDDPARRLTADGGVSAQLGKLFTRGSGPFGQGEAGLRLRWFPRAEGDDYEMTAQLRAGRSWGTVPFDDLFILGLERDNDLWLRAHIGTEDGRKGSAPLGRNYSLVNWNDSKNIYHNGFFSVKLGPFLDAGKITDPTRDFGSQQWLVDTGIEMKLQVLGSATVEFFLGKDLRAGHTTFYGTTGGF
ncbi:MAG: hypothetical protein ACRD2P_10060 [Terriglobia bacterium]